MTQDLAYSNSFLTQQTQLYIRNASIRRVKSTGKLGISYNTIRCYQLFHKIIEQFELNHRLYYPVYATAEELGIPVAINVGIPGPQVRSRCQDPVLLEDVLIDFPKLTVIGAHMGHPYEELLIQYIYKFSPS